MKISLTSLSSHFLWQQHTAGESVSTPIRLVTTVGNESGPADNKNSDAFSALLIVSVQHLLGGRRPRPQRFTRDTVSFAEGFCSAGVKPTSVAVNPSVCRAQTRAALFEQSCAITNTI